VNQSADAHSATEDEAEGQNHLPIPVVCREWDYRWQQDFEDWAML
jgi:hypothetical protein